MPEEILSLSTVVQRKTINIDGKLYECLNLADFGPFEFAQIVAMNEEVQELRKVKKPTAAQERQADKALDDMVKLIVPSLKPAVLKKLTSQQKQLIVFTWTATVREGVAEGNASTPRRRTTGGSSPGSRRSTAGTRRPGSTGRRGS